MRHRQTAFTLVELLAVVAVLSVLAALLVPSLEQAMKLSQVASCKNQMSQLYLLTAVYTVDNGECLPHNSVVGGDCYGTNGLFQNRDYLQPGELYAMGLYAPYISNVLDVYQCPGNVPCAEEGTYWAVSKWTAFVASGYRGGLASTWTYDPFPFFGMDYAVGWQYGNPARWPGKTMNFRPLTFQTRKPTLFNYSASRWTTLMADCNFKSTKRGAAQFHNNGEYQNLVRVDGSQTHILNYWNRLDPVVPSYANYYYWNVGDPVFYWWQVFSKE